MIKNLEPISRFEKIPPQSVEAEMCLLGSMMLLGDDTVVGFAEITSTISRDAFYQADHQLIFDALIGLQREGSAIDAIILSERLKRLGIFDEIGGVEYLGAILNKVPSAAHYAYYAKVIAGKYLLRQLIQISNEALRQAYGPISGESEVEAARGLLAKFAADAIAAMQAGSSSKVHKLSDVLPEIMAMRQRGNVRKHPTGFTDLDGMLGGLGYGKTHIVGALPGVGKSAFLKSIMRKIAGEGTPVGIISIEEDRHKIAVNLLSGESGVLNNRVQNATANNEEWETLAECAQTLTGLPIFVVDSEFNLSSIIAMANLLVAKHGCRCIMVDHLHIVDGEPGKGQSREQEIAKISKGLKQAWRSLDVIGVEACQFNTLAPGARPSSANLRDSRALHQDGDVIMLLHREDYVHRDETDYQRDNMLEVIIDKSKDGATGTISLYYDESRYLICDQVDKRPVWKNSARMTSEQHEALDGAF